MATPKYGTEWTNLYIGSNGTTSKGAPGEVAGEVKCMTASLTFDGTELAADDDILFLGKLPKDCRIVGCLAACDDDTAGATLNLGLFSDVSTALDEDALLLGWVPATAGTADMAGTYRNDAAIAAGTLDLSAEAFVALRVDGTPLASHSGSKVVVHVFYVNR